MPAIDRRRPPVLPHAADSTGRRAAIGYPRMMGGNPMKTLRRMAGGIAAITLLALGGCVGAVAEGANIAKDKATVSNNIEAARAGDAEAQYKVGDALCCSLNEGEGFYDTPHSVAWLCSAAAQRHGRSEEHTSELQSLMRLSYAVLCLKKKT